jgi:hypothetical protein
MAHRADHYGWLLSVRTMRIICKFPTSYARDKTCLKKMLSLSLSC